MAYDQVKNKHKIPRILRKEKGVILKEENLIPLVKTRVITRIHSKIRTNQSSLNLNIILLIRRMKKSKESP